MNLQETDALIQEHKAKRAVLDSVGNPLIQRGEHLISSIKANEPPVPPSQNFPGSPALAPSQELQQVERIVTQLTHRCNQLTDMWEKRWKELIQCMDLREFEAGYKKVKHLHGAIVVIFFKHCHFFRLQHSVWIRVHKSFLQLAIRAS